jgi:hypothetical protein
MRSTFPMIELQVPGQPTTMGRLAGAPREWLRAAARQSKMERCLRTGLPEQKEENVSGYNGMETYFRWIENVLAIHGPYLKQYY